MTRTRSLHDSFVMTLALALTGPGCATALHGSTQKIHVESVPPGATVHDTRTGESWLTPADVELERRQRQHLEVTKDGYRIEDVFLRSEVPWVWWIPGWLTLGLLIAPDAILGGLWELRPDHVNVVLQPGPTLSSPP